MPRRLQSGCGAFRLDFDGGLGGEAEETALFLPVTRERRPLIASMLSWDPERNWFRIAIASSISSTRPALTFTPGSIPDDEALALAGAPHLRFELFFPTCSAAAIFARLSWIGLDRPRR